MAACNRLAFALDVASLEEAEKWLELLAPHVGVFKVGLELFTRLGPAAVETVHARGAECFLDLKLHDIPATVASAVRAAVDLKVRYLTVHSTMGRAALTDAVQAASQSSTSLLAVTVLTSLDNVALRSLGVNEGTPESVLRRAELALSAGVGGLVCSPRECKILRARFGEGPALVVPGVRPEGGADLSRRGQVEDQRRVATPEAAIADGATLLVVGRPIRLADDPLEAARRIRVAIEGSGPSA